MAEWLRRGLQGLGIVGNDKGLSPAQVRILLATFLYLFIYSFD